MELGQQLEEREPFGLVIVEEQGEGLERECRVRHRSRGATETQDMFAPGGLDGFLRKPPT